MQHVQGIGNWTMARAVVDKKGKEVNVCLVLTDPAGIIGDIWTHAQTIALNDIDDIQTLRDLCDRLIERYNEDIEDAEEERPPLPREVRL